MKEKHATGASDSGAPLKANFLQFVSGMAAQTLMHLGLMANPLTGKVETDLPNAGYSIDLLAVFQEKTRGNLTEDEQRYLETALCDLRLQYVRVCSQSGQGEDAPAEPAAAAEEPAPDTDAKEK